MFQGFAPLDRDPRPAPGGERAQQADGGEFGQGPVSSSDSSGSGPAALRYRPSAPSRRRRAAGGPRRSGCPGPARPGRARPTGRRAAPETSQSTASAVRWASTGARDPSRPRRARARGPGPARRRRGRVRRRDRRAARRRSRPGAVRRSVGELAEQSRDAPVRRLNAPARAIRTRITCSVSRGSQPASVPARRSSVCLSRRARRPFEPDYPEGVNTVSILAEYRKVL